MKKLLVLLAMVTSVSALAYHARVDVAGLGGEMELVPGKASKGCGLSNPGWVKDPIKRKKSIYFASPKLGQDWQEAEFSFTPSQDGKIRIRIGGQWHNAAKGGKPYYVFYKEVEVVEGGSLVNGDFSQKDAAGELVNWSTSKSNKPVVAEEEGATIVKMEYNNGMWQEVEVKKDQVVKIKVVIKNATPATDN